MGAKGKWIRGDVSWNTLSYLSFKREWTSVNTVSGAVECSRLRGPLHVNSVSGAVTAQSSDLPDVSIHTVSGDIALDLTNETAAISSNSVSGDVTVRAPHRGYDVRANTASGQVVVDGRELRRGPHAAGGQLTEGDGALRVKANAVSGNIVVLRSDRGGAGTGTADEKAV
jgi:DUF4097 and DUF4098 domain-containing protein YvlB